MGPSGEDMPFPSHMCESLKEYVSMCYAATMGNRGMKLGPAGLTSAGPAGALALSIPLAPGHTQPARWCISAGDQ